MLTEHTQRGTRTFIEHETPLALSSDVVRPSEMGMHLRILTRIIGTLLILQLPPEMVVI